MSVCLRAKFQVSSITLTIFRWRGGNFTPPPPFTSKRTPKKPTQIRAKREVQKQPTEVFCKTTPVLESLFNKVSGLKVWISRNFEEHLFWRTSANGCFCKSQVWILQPVWFNIFINDLFKCRKAMSTVPVC